MVQKTGIIVQKKNYTLRTWQTEDAASLAKYLNNLKSATTRII